MNLDLRTMMVMLAVLSFLFSLLLGVASLHARGIQGLRQWSLASLFISLGFGVAYTQLTPGNGWAVVAGAVFLAAGSALQLLGIQAFKEQPSQWLVLSAVVTLVVTQTIWFTIVHPDVQLRATANSIVFAALNFACARALLISIKTPERTAYWLTGSSFALLAISYSLRAVSILSAPANSYGLYNPLPINPVMFFMGSVTHLFLTFGFILMVNYRMAAELENLATTDSLTGAWNRHSLELKFQSLLARSMRHQETLSVMMMDVDHFKRINDNYGHQAGDEVLRQLIINAKMEIRRDDYLARYGGEEFCLLLPATSEEEAEDMAERLRLSHTERPVHWRGTWVSSTISIGVASSEHIGLDLFSLLEAADTALYRAKQTGRDKVVAFSTIQ
ncbi:MAG: GGDEF domain-containing protein [Methylobacter sp.]|nr:GGDEF domain-containing protein [Methylobacter sp.]